MANLQDTDLLAVGRGAATYKATFKDIKDNLPAVPDASETAKGVVELATAAETTTGTDDTRAVHPAGLKVELDKKAPLASPAFTGVPAAPTAAAGTKTTQLATTAFVDAAITAQPSASETVKGIAELATQAETTAGTDDLRFVTPKKLKVELDKKAPLASPALTGVPTAPTAAAGTNTTQLATTGFVTAATPDSTETVKGLVELATAAETTTGTDSTRAVHPAGLKVELDKKVKLAGDTMTGNLTVPSLNGGPLAGFRNQIINGQIYVNQRGPGPFGAGQQYTSDRWKVSAGDRVTVTDGGPLNSNRLVVAGAAVDIAQGVELTPLAGRPGPFAQGSVWTVSVWATAAVNLSVAFVDTVLSPTNAAPVKAGGPMTATSETDNGFTKYIATFTVGVAPNPTNNALQIGFNGVTGSIALAQLEPGSVATPFECRLFTIELALCYRYFQKPSTGISAYSDLATWTYWKSYVYPVEMRVDPTVQVFGSASSNVANITAADSTYQRLVFGIQSAAAGNFATFLSATSSAEL